VAQVFLIRAKKIAANGSFERIAGRAYAKPNRQIWPARRLQQPSVPQVIKERYERFRKGGMDPVRELREERHSSVKRKTWLTV